MAAVQLSYNSFKKLIKYGFRFFSRIYMPLGQKIFEESGKTVGFKVIKVHPIEGTEMEISFVSDTKGFGKHPSGKNIGSGIIKQYPNGITDTTLQGTSTTTDGDQIFFWAHSKGKLVEGGKEKDFGIMSGFTNSQKLSWVNSMIVAFEAEIDSASQQYKLVGYEWIPQ